MDAVCIETGAAVLQLISWGMRRANYDAGVVLVRMSAHETAALASLAEEAGESRPQVVRRLIKESAAREQRKK